MTIVMWIPVHPRKATHFENRKSSPLLTNFSFFGLVSLKVNLRAKFAVCLSRSTDIRGPKIWKVGHVT